MSHTNNQTKAFFSKQTLTWLLGTACLLQLVVLGSQLVSAAYPHYAGKTIKVNVVPVDPRSLFRGNYARMNYRFSTLSAQQLGVTEKEVKNLRVGESVYLVLKKDKDGIHTFSYAQLNKPTQIAMDEHMLHGRIGSRRWRRGSRLVDYGIDAYFAPKDKALALETELRSGGIATLKVTDSGRAALVDVTGR